MKFLNFPTDFWNSINEKAFCVINFVSESKICDLFLFRGYTLP